MSRGTAPSVALFVACVALAPPLAGQKLKVRERLEDLEGPVPTCRWRTSPVPRDTPSRYEPRVQDAWQRLAAQTAP
jgi:hypothetical protein